MEEFLKALFSALSSELPFMAILIIGAALWAFGSTGIFVGGGKIDERLRKILRLIGGVLTIIGALTTIITILLFFLDIVAPYRPYLINIWSAIIKFFSPVVLLVIGLIVLSLIAAKLYRTRQIEKGYKIQKIPILDQGSAGIQIENLGRGKITCAARLVNVEWEHLWDKERPKANIPVHIFNPKGAFLGWTGQSENHAVLSEGIPTVLELITTHHGEAKFIFAQYETSVALPTGYYEIQAKILRWKDGRWINFDKFEGTLKIESGIQWVE